MNWDRRERQLENTPAQLSEMREMDNIQKTAVPENVISFKLDGFDINIDNMDMDRKYRFWFDDTLYEIWKNTNGELEIKEIQ